MVRLREIPRTAAFAWSPDATAPWIATGTKSGAVDVDFSNETCLELWDLGLDNAQQAQELQPSVTLPTESGFHDLAWTSAQGERKRGIIAGAFDSGSLSLWDADQLVTDAVGACLFDKKIHTGAIKALQFNPKIPTLLATGGSKGELFISDLNDLGSPTRLGSTAARADDIDCLDWNKKVSNILVTGSSGGFVTVWDMKTRKESLTLNNYQRKPASAIAWDPEKPTRLITAVPLEQEPVILVWDLRNSNAPEKILRGHDSGVLSLSWCPQDNDLLLSSGKDNRTMLWNPQTGEAYGEYPVVTNWTFQTRWNPHNPNMFATASFDGKVQIQTLQNTKPSSEQTTQSQAADGEDFFSQVQTQPQASSFSLSKAPRWLERPVSVSFGFGGRIISVRQADPGKSRLSKVGISKFEVDSSVGDATESFEKAIQSGDVTSLCEERIESAKTDAERADWKIIETLVSKNPRAQIVKYLGFEDTPDDAANGVKQQDQADGESGQQPEPVNGTSRPHRRFGSIWAGSADGDFLSELAATKVSRTNNPFQIYTGSESESDKKITRALTLGQFDKALDVCLQEDRMSDAFMIAICGGESCVKKAQEAYFAKQSGGPNYLRLLASIVGKNLWDTVHNADLSNWKEVMATLCTFADEQEFPDLCEALGDRIEEQADEQSSAARKDATFCFLAGSKLEKVVAIWIQELKEHEEAGATDANASSAFSLHAHGLQEFIEKVTIFRKVVNFQDRELSQTGDWKLEALYSKYLEYADIVAGSGQLDVAQRYLDLLPAGYPGADVARSRIQQARKKPVAPVAKAQTTSTPTRNKPLPGMSAFQPPTNTFTPPVPQAPTQFMGSPQAPTPFAGAPPQPANPYAPPAAAGAPVNPYAPAGGYQPQQQMRMPQGPPQGYGFHQANPIAPPPRFTQSPAVPPPSQDKNMSNWNDIPEGFVKPPTTSRRGTPSVTNQPVSNPYSQMPPQQPSPPVAPPFGSRQRATPLPPPPKGSALPPRVTSPMTGGPTQAPFERPASAASNAYAPPAGSAPSTAPNIMSPPIPRGASPYNAPPSHGPSAPSRYAPAPGSQPSVAPQGRPTIAPPPQGSSFQAPTLANPYAPSQPAQQPRPSPYGAPSLSQIPQQATAPPLPTPSQQFISGPPPSSAPPQQAGQGGQPPGAPQQAAPPPARRHPKGDRTHISESAQPIFQILSAEMARVKARAPASFEPQVRDTEKRLDILFDHLNNEDLLRPDTVAQISNLATALQNRDFQTATEIQMDVHTNKVEECGNWMVGVKRLVGMCKATP
ncbi:protein transport protein S31 [Elasticomyces elasticus]|uniref:Protein transport protein SEC31 n=1 Tax=Exophiala sideris TaxID=1016849 RepID=A0ABR0JRR3_9EURO|nr:protein transport protein S31 [Elasticomyces elasticus]KAK5040268.1 protein transport protein S31 [Exophiala sideris]KAK5043306.1 protein transport protein S31 [Exophiala sideris]KAK5068646.1 protein transport protein S31 [Exophiala sideris]KAK5186244.1 protein transport protein S31 [Eurotiomycetes sp. CCFEE 6388]